MQFLCTIVLFLLPALVASHARIRYPTPLQAMPETTEGNAYNKPLNADGSEFPCRNLHKTIDLNDPNVNKTQWDAGKKAYFEILGQVTPGVEGPLAAHSGGSCQASISFDNGATFKALHSFEGGCPRGVDLGSNIAKDPNQKFEFMIPSETKNGPALFAWTWTAVSGNRNEFFMNCAAIEIIGSGSSKLEDFPNMHVGDMQIPGQIKAGECGSTAGTALEFPNAGKPECVTRSEVKGIPFKKPTEGKCYAPASKGGNTEVDDTTSVPISTVPVPTGPSDPKPTGDAASLMPSIKIDVDGKAGTCKCTCELP